DVAAVASLRADVNLGPAGLGWGNGVGRPAVVVELEPPPEFFGLLSGQAAAGLNSMRLEPLDRDIPPLAGWPVLAEAPATLDEPDPFDLNVGAVTFSNTEGLPDAPAVDGVGSDVAPDLVDEQAPWVATSEGTGAIAPEPPADG